MKIKRIKCHQAVHFEGRENLGFTAGMVNGYPKGLTITYDEALRTFKVMHGENHVMVTRENVPYFEVDGITVINESATKRKNAI